MVSSSYANLQEEFFMGKITNYTPIVLFLCFLFWPRIANYFDNWRWFIWMLAIYVSHYILGRVRNVLAFVSKTQTPQMNVPFMFIFFILVKVENPFGLGCWELAFWSFVRSCFRWLARCARWIPLAMRWGLFAWLFFLWLVSMLFPLKMFFFLCFLVSTPVFSSATLPFYLKLN